MNYGLYLSASGVLTHSYRQDVAANNLANVHTRGFKPDIALAQARPSKSGEDFVDMAASRQLLDRLGGGVLAAPQRIDFAPGTVETTGNPLDVALRNPDEFFSVMTTSPDGGTETALTRDGRFAVNNDGELVTQAGLPVLNASGRPITGLEAGDIRISKSGAVTLNNAEVERLGIVRPGDLTALEKRGSNLLALKRPTALDQVEEPTLTIEALEGSAAHPMKALLSVIKATKAATGNANMIRYHDTLMDRAVNTLGRVA